MRRELLVGNARAAALALLLAGCAGASEHVGQGEAAIVGPVWVAEEIAGAPAGGEAPITLQLGADGNASGRGGCNGYGGPYTLAGAADGLRARPHGPGAALLRHARARGALRRGGRRGRCC